MICSLNHEISICNVCSAIGSLLVLAQRISSPRRVASMVTCFRQAHANPSAHAQTLPRRLNVPPKRRASSCSLNAATSTVILTRACSTRFRHLRLRTSQSAWGWPPGTGGSMVSPRSDMAVLKLAPSPASSSSSSPSLSGLSILKALLSLSLEACWSPLVFASWLGEEAEEDVELDLI